MMAAMPIAETASKSDENPPPWDTNYLDAIIRQTV
jgi:hypothetical protein